MKSFEEGQGCTIDHPANDALKGRARPALPLNTLQNSPKGLGKGGQPALSSPAGEESSRVYAHLAHQKEIKEDLANKKAMPVPSYYVQDTDNLSGIDERLLNETVHCTPKFLVKQCGCGESGRKIYPQTCMKSFCISCQKFYIMKRARRAMSRMESLSWRHDRQTYFPNIIYTVFTIPEHLRWKYIDPKKARLLRSKIWQLLKTKYGAIWSLESTHPISEKNPEKFHPHFNFLWQSEKWKTGYIDSNELLKLKLDYSDLIGYEYIPDVRTRYSKEPAKLWKWAQYVTRTFPEYVRWAGPVRYFGKVPKAEKKEAVICEKCLEKFFVLGYLTSEKSAEYLEHDPTSGRPPPVFSSYDINFLCDKH
jgi:hypothetical protein